MSVSVRLGLEKVGGRYALSPWLVIVSAPFFITGIVATEISADTLNLWWLYALAGLVAQIVLAVVLLLGGRLLFGASPPPSKPPVIILVLYLVASQARALSFDWALEAFSLSNESPLFVRLLTSAVLITSSFAFSSYSLESYRRHLEARESLVHSLVQAREELERQQAVSETLRESLLGKVDSEISQANTATLQALDSLDGRLRSGEDVRPELQTLLDEADQRWRSISHSTWRAANLDVPQPTRDEFFRVLLGSRPLSITAITIGSLFLYVLGLSRSLAPLDALWWTTVWLAVTVPQVLVFNVLGKRVPYPPFVVFLTGSLLLVAVGVWLFSVPGLTTIQGWGAFTLHVLIIGTAIGVGYGPAMGRNQQLVLEALQDRLDDSTLERLKTESEMMLLAQKVASRLHANNRGFFLARVTALQKALDRGNREEAIEALNGVRSALSEVGETSNSDTEDFELVGFLDNWRGLVDIHTNLHTANIPDHLHPAINTLVMDAVNDAVRHGGADWIDVSVENVSGVVRLTVVNNGQVPEGGVQGIGSRTLDRLADAGWFRETDALGFTRLTANLISDGASPISRA